MLAKVRSFFQEGGVLEVDCPALSLSAPIDLHIEVMSVHTGTGKTGYLHTSPEYGMKQLLSLGIGSIYQMSHVFRSGEIGPLHNPEFTMIEWYRKEIPFKNFIEETCSLIHLFLGDLPSEHFSYRAALQKYAGIDYVTASIADLLDCAKAHALTLSKDASNWDKDTLLQLLMSFIVEPHLGRAGLTIIDEYPDSQAALAKTVRSGDQEVAKRFEIYRQGIELANGYHELTDPQEQRRRLHESNRKRALQGKATLPIDEHFLQSLEQGLPDCCGVAVGFDRLMLLRHNTPSLREILPIAWEE